MEDYPCYGVNSVGMYGDPDAPLTARIDVKKASMVNDVGLDDIVTITLKGKVKSIAGAREEKGMEYMGKGKEKEVKRLFPGSLEIEVSSIKVMGEGYGAALDDED